MIKVLKANWGMGTATITNVNELRSVIDRVRGFGNPTMLFLEAATGAVLVLGLGAKESVLTFAEKDGTTFHSVGDLKRTGYLKFRNQDLIDDFHAEMAIPEPRAIDAALEFFETGLQPKNVSWEADW